MINALIALYLFFGTVFALVLLITWLRDNVDTDAMDGEEGCMLVIIAIVVFIVLTLLWLPVTVALRISKHVNGNEETEDENES